MVRIFPFLALSQDFFTEIQCLTLRETMKSLISLLLLSFTDNITEAEEEEYNEDFRANNIPSNPIQTFKVLQSLSAICEYLLHTLIIDHTLPDSRIAEERSQQHNPTFPSHCS